MKRIGSSSHSVLTRSSRSANREPQGRGADELQRRRREWMIQQKKQREHEELKKKMIEKYERDRRAKEKAAKNHTRRLSSRSRSRSKSELSNGRKREETQASPAKSAVMSQKFESSSNNTRLFKGPEGTKIDVTQLRRIKVDIHRNISDAEPSIELQREIINPEDVKVKRREGEGSKPIFDRDELKKNEILTSEVVEHRTVVAFDADNTEKRQHSRNRSATPTSSRKRSSSRREVDGQSTRHESFRHVERSPNYRSSRHESERERGRSRESGDRHKRENSRQHRSPERSSHRGGSRDHRNRQNRSHSGHRESRRRDARSSIHRSSRHAYREYRESSRENSRDRRNRDRSRERRIPLLQNHYAETMQLPLYYQPAYHPRPMMVGPMLPIRGHIPIGRGRMHPMMGPMRPPYQRFMPPEMYRPALHPNPRFGQMF